MKILLLLITLSLATSLAAAEAPAPARELSTLEQFLSSTTRSWRSCSRRSRVSGP
ncbi:hypothetical protein [Oleiharenicola sp. Vm1]|uniref:hypothetical protein n=1 Tax=Oleiharenicola sp. Vm1 TaxID=3398393 RepID=UPI0039F57E31